MKLFLKNPNGSYDAVAEYNVQSNEFIVLKGSRVSYTISASPTFQGTIAIKNQRALHVKDNIVQEDVSFRSSSAAGNFVTGYSTNGPKYWKNEKGIMLKVIMQELKR